MLHVIKNEYITVSVETKGAELQSIQSADGVEYLWQGDSKYWGGQAPNLFPYIARMTEGKYTYAGNTYEMGKHGFARQSEFQVEEHTEDRMVFCLEDSDATYMQYPFRFKFRVIYELQEKKLLIDFRVDNKEETPMYFGIGGHPGFNVPLDNLAFEDYYLEFSEKCKPKRIEFTPDCMVSEHRPEYALMEDDKIPMTHELFDDDAIVLTDVAKEVVLKSDKGSRSIRVGYPDMKFIGFWHMPKMDAPYVCIEPWSTLPSRQDIIEELDKQPDIVELEGKKVYNNQWWVEIN